MISLETRIKFAGRHGVILDYIEPRCGKELASEGSPAWSAESIETPLLPPGMWVARAAELHSSMVSNFPRSTTRPRLWAALVRMVDELATHQPAEELWLGGSFVTAKLDPNDIDLVVVLSAARFDRARPDARRDLYERVLDQGALLADGLDASAFFEGDRILRAYWQGAFTFGHGTTPRGIAVLPLAGARAT